MKNINILYSGIIILFIFGQVNPSNLPLNNYSIDSFNVSDTSLFNNQFFNVNIPENTTSFPESTKLSNIQTIDPSNTVLPPMTLLFSSIFESLGEERSTTGSMVMAPDDSVIVGGSTTSQTLQMTDAYDYTYNGGQTDAFFLHILSNGKILKSSYFGGNGNDAITKIAIDSNNDVIIAGLTESSDLPYTENSYDFVYNGFSDIFLLKFTYNGDLLWSTYFGGSYTDTITDLVLDSDDNIYITGSTDSSNFPSFNQSLFGNTDAFISKFSSNGSLLHSNFIGGSSNDYASDLSIYNSSLIVAGSTSSTDFSFFNTETNPIHGESDSFIVSFDLNLNQTKNELIYGGNGFETNTRIAYDGVNLILAGNSNSTNSPTTSDFSQSSNINKTSIFLNTVSLTNNSILWSRFFGGSNYDYINDLQISTNDIITITGKTNSSNTFPIRNAYDKEFEGGFDGYFSQFDNKGKLISSSFLGGSSNDEIFSITFDFSGQLYLNGITEGNFPQTMSNSYLNTSELFVTKFSQIQDPYVVNRFGSYCSATENTCEGKFYNPWGLAIGNDNNLYVVDSANNDVQVLDQSGTFIRKFGSSGSENGNFSGPSDIAIKSDGKIFVSDTNNHRIQIFNSDGTFYGFINSSNGTTITSPMGLAFNESDFLFITDSKTYKISIFDPALTLVSQFGGFGTDNGKFNNYLSGIAVKNGFIYVSDRGNSRIQVFDLKGNYIRQWGKHGNSIGEFNAVFKIFVTNNFLYVVDYNNHRMQIFTLNGAFVSTIVGLTDNNQNQFRYPVGIAVNSSGYIYLSSIYYHSIIVFNPVSISNSLTVNLDYIPHFTYKQYTIIDNTPPSFPSGFDISFGTSNKYLYAIDNATNTIKKFSFFDSGPRYTEGFIEILGPSGNGTNTFNQSSDIAINETNSYYITDTNNNRVLIYNSSDKYIKSFGIIGSQNGSFNKPIGIAISSFNDYIYVVDSGNNRIQIFDWNGTFKGKWGSLGSENNQFNHPYGIAVDNKNGNVYVADQNNNRIQVFNSTGSFLFAFGKKGNLAGEFLKPGHIVIDTRSYVYVTDIGNGRIQVFDENGIYKTTEYGVVSSNVIGSINGIAIDSNDNLYYNYYQSYGSVSSTYYLKYARSSTYVTKIGSPYFSFSSQQEVLSITVDPYGKTISAGLINNSVVNFDISTQKTISSLITHNNPVNALDYSSDGLILATGGSDNKITLSYKNGSNLNLIGHNGPIYAIKFFDNNKLLASGSSDKTIKIWNVSSGSLITTLANHSAGILSLSISPDDNTLISGSFDKTIKIWNLTSYTLLKTLTSHTDFVSGIEFSPNGKYFVSVSYDRRVIFWNAKTFTELGRMLKHTDKIYSVAFNPDSSEFATSDKTGMIYVWNVASKKASWQLKDHTGIVYALKYSPDGSFLISGGADKRIKIWSISSQIESDLDRDGMNDLWEANHGLSPYDFADKFLDSDNDGIINSIEALLGSNPQSNDTDRDGFSDIFEFSSGLNPIYNDRLEDKDQDGMINIYEFENGLNLLDPSDASKDLDNDGLTNLQEYQFGSYANKKDSDGDLIPDNIEYLYGLQPLIKDSGKDLDSDGMPNLWEYQNGLKLDFNDSYLDLDNDGMPNIFEFKYSFDPQHSSDATQDADGDGYTNLEEYQMGTNPRDATDPPIQTSTTLISNSSYNFFADPLVFTSVAIMTISGAIIGGTVYAYRGYLRKKDEFRL